MRVLLITHAFGPDFSPPQRRWSSFVDTFLRQGIDVDVIAPRRRSDKNWDPFAAIPRTEKTGTGFFRAFQFSLKGGRWYSKLMVNFLMIGFMFPKALAAPKPDLLIVTVPALPNLIAGYLISRFRRVPLVLEMRDAWPELIVESGVIRNRLLEKLMVDFIRKLQHAASLTITVTNGQASQLRADGSNNVRVVSNGYRFANLPRKRSHRNSSDGKLRVIYLGNLGESQGLSKVLDVAAVSQEWLELKIVGRGSASAQLRARADQLGLTGVFEEPVKGDRVLELYDWADTCLVSLRDDWPSFNYTVPSKLFELAGFGAHISGLVVGEPAELIERYRLGHTFHGDVVGISKSLHSKIAEIKAWKPQVDLSDDFIHRYDYDNLALAYIDILNKHLKVLRNGDNA